MRLAAHFDALRLIAPDRPSLPPIKRRSPATIPLPGFDVIGGGYAYRKAYLSTKSAARMYMAGLSFFQLPVHI